MSEKCKDMIVGKKIRELRDEQGVLQRQLAALLEIDTPMFSKIERGDRRAKRKHVIKLAEYLHQDEKEMLMLWLADKVLDAVGDDELSYDAITVAQEQIQKGAYGHSLAHSFGPMNLPYDFTYYKISNAIAAHASASAKA